jgi:tRNA(fMet)-specific endonuclease VapC
MAGEYAVDTNVLTAFLGGDRDVLKEMARAKKIWLPIPVLGELIYGALKSTNKEANLKEISKLLLLAGIIECDEKVADRYGRIRQHS